MLAILAADGHWAKVGVCAVFSSGMREESELVGCFLSYCKLFPVELYPFFLRFFSFLSECVPACVCPSVSAWREKETIMIFLFSFLPACVEFVVSRVLGMCSCVRFCTAINLLAFAAAAFAAFAAAVVIVTVLH